MVIETMPRVRKCIIHEGQGEEKITGVARGKEKVREVVPKK